MTNLNHHHLLLVRHSQPEITLGAPAREWRLSAEGRARCQPLADEIGRRYSPVAIVSSDEPKAIETADLIAERLNIPVEIALDLREHERDEDTLLGEAAFQIAIADFFAHPAELVFGKETAVSALFRFRNGVADVLGAHPTGDIVAITHGRVLSLYLGALSGTNPFSVWKTLKLPDLRAIARPDETATQTPPA